MPYMVYLIIVFTQYISPAALSSCHNHVQQCDDSISNQQLSNQVKTIQEYNCTASFKKQQQDESEKWYLAYLEEYVKKNYDVKVIDKSLDTRVANILYTKNKVNVIGFDYYKFDYDDPSIRREYESYISGPEVDQVLCTKHLQQMNALLDELEQINSYQRHPSSDRNNSSLIQLDERHVRMAHVLDSYGRYESGVLIGRADLIGSSEQCLETKLHLGHESNQQVVGTRYCKATFGFESDLDPRIRENSRVYIHSGICLPNTCHSNSLKDNKHLIQRLVDSQFLMPDSIYIAKHREIDDLFCLNDNNTPIGLPLSGKIFVVAAIAWSILLTGTTYYAGALKHMRSKPAKIIEECFNAKELILDFIEYDRHSQKNHSDRPHVNLDALNIVKVISMLAVIIGHSLLAVINFSANLIGQISSFKKDHFLSMLLTLNFVVDTIFVISGLLFGYISLRKFKAELDASNTMAQISKLAGKLFFGRYWRLVPLYFIAFWFKKSVYLYSGSGPLWNHGFNQFDSYGACKQQSWQTPLTHLSAYMPLGQQCIFPAWTLGSEIFFIFLTTPAMIMFNKKPKLTIYIISAVGFACYLMSYDAFLKMDPADLRSLNSFGNNMMHLAVVKYSHIYTNPNYRLLSVLIGLVSGYILYCYERDLQKWPTWFTNYATKIALATFAATLVSHSMIPLFIKFDLQDSLVATDLFIHTEVTFRAAWAFASCILFLRMVTERQGTSIVRLFSGRFGRMMCKLNLAALLIHTDFIFIKYIIVRDLRGSYSFFKWLDASLIVYMYTIVLSALIHVFIESPINKLIQSVVYGYKNDVLSKKQLE